MDGFARFRELIASYWDEDSEPDPARVVVVIETDRGPWVTALVAAGYRVYAINPMSVARYRERHSTSGAKSDSGDAWLLAAIEGAGLTSFTPLLGRHQRGCPVRLSRNDHGHPRLIFSGYPLE